MTTPCRLDSLKHTLTDEIRRAIQGAIAAGDWASAGEMTRLATLLSVPGSGQDLATKPAPAQPANIVEPASTPSRSLRRAQFYRSGDDLVKIGRAKRGRESYQHRAGKSTVEALVRSLVAAQVGELPVSMDKLLPLKDAKGVEIPSYQAYVGLGWLRQAGLVVQHGRQGYSVADPGDMSKRVDEAWKKLRVRRA